MRVFLAGIMQGSLADPVLHDQDYRRRLTDLVQRHFPRAELYDPLADHAGSVAYNDDVGRQVFYGHNRLCRQVDVVLAYVPQASMGTAIEMWEAHEHGRGVVIAISPLTHNWAIRYCSHLVYPDLSAFAAALEAGEAQAALARLLAERRSAIAIEDSP